MLMRAPTASPRGNDLLELTLSNAPGRLAEDDDVIIYLISH